MNTFVKYDNKSVSYSSRGSGNALVLLHGFTENKQIWEPLSEKLAKDLKVITIDLPGHGKTDVFRASHTMEFMSDIVKAVLDHLGIKQCVMIGHSMGGYVTAAFARKYPKFISGLGFFHSHAAADTDQAKANRLRTIKMVERSRKNFIQKFIPELFAQENIPLFSKEIDQIIKQALSTPSEGITAALRGMIERKDNLDLLKETRKPVLFIAGKSDTKIPLELILNQAALAHQAEILILGNVGHMGLIEAKEQTTRAIHCFVKKTSKQKSAK